MKETLTKESPVHAKVNIQLPPDRVNVHLTAFFKEVAKHAKIQGFRKGKAPTHVVKKMYQQEAGSQVSEKLISEALYEVIQKHDLKLILPPTLIAVDSPVEGKEFNFEASLDLKPDVPEIDLKSLEVKESDSKEITDKEVDEQIEKQREQFLHYHDLKTERAAIESDAVTVSYTGNVDGEKVDEASTEDQELVLGRGHTLKEFEEAIKGMKVGEMKEIEVSFPEDHQVEAVKGRTVKFHLTVKKIKEQHLPALDDELAKKIDPSVESVAQLKEKTKSKLVAQTKFQAQKALRDSVGEALVEKYSFEVNDRQKKMTAENMLRDQIQQMAQFGMNQEAIKSQQTELLANASKEAEKQIRLAYILEKIARENELKVEDSDIEQRIEKTAELSGASVEQVKQYYATPEENDEAGQSSRMDRLKLDLLDEKSLDYALSQAKLVKRGNEKK